MSKSFENIAKKIRRINDLNGWTYPKDAWENKYFVSSILALMHSEISEALESYRGSKVFTPVTRYELNAFGKPFYIDGKYYVAVNGEKAELGYMKKPTEDEIEKLFAFELADVFIRVLDASTGLKIDLEKYILEKIEINAKRGYKHGGKKI